MKTLKALILFVLAFGLNIQSFASEKILECMQIVYLDDPGFVQGSELFFDIYWDEVKGVEVVLTTGDLRTETILPFGTASRKVLDLSDRSFSAEWKEPGQVQLGLRQFDTRWYGGFWFSNGLESNVIEILPGRDVNLSCIEKGSLKSH